MKRRQFCLLTALSVLSVFADYLQYKSHTNVGYRGWCCIRWCVGGVVFVDAKFVAAVILPHGDYAYDPTLANDESVGAQYAANTISQAAHTAGLWLGGARRSNSGRFTGWNETDGGIDPDVIFLSTPHGISLTNDFAVYMNSFASGSVTIGADLHRNDDSASYTVTLPPIRLASDMGREIVNKLRLLNSSSAVNVSGVEIPGINNQLLGWGEIIPLLLIPRRQQPQHQQQRHRLQIATPDFVGNAREHLIWSHPSRRYDSAVEMIPELLYLGEWLGQYFNTLQQRVAVVVSGDLSHTHEASGPYGYSETAAWMDAAIGSWATNPCPNAYDLLQTAASLQTTALSCGFTGFVLLHGMMCGSYYRRRTDQAWESQVLVNRNVTYYGMMVARFITTET